MEDKKNSEQVCFKFVFCLLLRKARPRHVEAVAVQRVCGPVAQLYHMIRLGGLVSFVHVYIIEATRMALYIYILYFIN